VPARPATERFRIAQVAEPASQTTREVKDLLRQRFRIGGLIATVAFVFFLIDVTSTHFRGPRLSLAQWGIVAQFWLMFSMLSALTVLLWTRLPISLTGLRTMETVAVAIILAHVSWVLWLDLHFGASLHRALEATEGTLGHYVHNWAFPFFVLIVLYGTFIPNTGRRCFVVVGITALLPVAILAVAGVSDGITLAGKFGFLLLYLAMFMAIAVAVATYGSHRIEVLRQEAAAARKLGQYQLQRLLGTGGMGDVYLAEHALLRRPCAVKLIRPERAGEPHALRRFEREVHATAQLTHPNVVEIYDYGRAADGTFYYVMEYLDGLTLDELVARPGPLPPARAVHLLRQVCSALRAAHGRGLIHRDLKPANIFVCEGVWLHDIAKLLDFGLVQAPALEGDGQKLTQEGAVAGTPAYMSPEQAAGLTELDGRSDLYSLGCVAYFLLTGRPPFVGKTSMQVLAAHMYEAVAPPRQYCPDVPADLEAVILRCLEREPAQRFPSADELEQALARCHCAGQWTCEQAAAWWRGQAAGYPRATGPVIDCGR
jgi:serine/threonine-protein kinase